MKSILIDTDIILDFFFDREPFSENAAEIFSLCESKTIKGYITPVIISNTYYLLRKIASHDKVLEKLNQLLLITNVLIMDREVVINAINSKFKDFEDALQNYSAIKHGKIEAIITRNIKDYKNSDIGIFTPETYLKLEKACR
ncbi:MAG: PIN domain-containing protein [Bacteroidota bacterium]